MRTTLSIADELLLAAKRRARERGLTLGEVVNQALQRELTDPDRAPDAPEIPVFEGGSGPRPGIDLSSNRGLLEALDDGLELDERR